MNRKFMLSAVFICLILFTFSISDAAEWCYEGCDYTPDKWNEISEVCGNGKQQSPINFSQSKLEPKKERVKRKKLYDIEFNYKETPLKILNNGHTVEVEYEAGSTIRLEKKGQLYEILQFHFHCPSEHSFDNGALYDCELHIVHRSNKNKLAVIGVMIKEGHENLALKAVTDHLEDVIDKDTEYLNEDVEINIEDALSNDRRYYAYSGSLTTPPCSEDVEWRVLYEPIEMSREQINAFIAVFDNSCCPVNGNNRPVQPLNNRKIFLDKNTKK